MEIYSSVSYNALLIKAFYTLRHYYTDTTVFIANFTAPKNIEGKIRWLQPSQEERDQGYRIVIKHLQEVKQVSQAAGLGSMSPYLFTW